MKKTDVVKINGMLIVAILCLFGFCAVIVLFKVVTLMDLPLTFIGAALGAVITGVVTTVLLNGQRKNEEIKERNVAVFKKKSKIFKKYIDTIWEVWDDHTLGSNEYMELTSAYYKELMLYMKESSAKAIGGCLKKLGPLIEEKLPNTELQKLRDPLIEIINTLSDEISLGGHINEELFIDLDTKMEVCRNRRERTTFKMLKVKPGTELVLKNRPDVVCKTVDETNKVSYNEEVLSISALSSRILGRPSNGFSEFLLGEKTLFELRG